MIIDLKSIVWLLLLQLIIVLEAQKYSCPSVGTGVGDGDSTVGQKVEQITNLDLVFIVDLVGASGEQYFNQIKSQLLWMSRLLLNRQYNAIDARVAVVTIGGMNTLRLAFSSSLEDVTSVLNVLRLQPVFQESSLESLRQVLSAPEDALQKSLVKNCPLIQGSACQLEWRADAKKKVILFTYGDSDLPGCEQNMYPQQKDVAFCAIAEQNGRCKDGFAIEPAFVPSSPYQLKRQTGEQVIYRQFVRIDNDQKFALAISFQAELNGTVQTVVQSKARLLIFGRSDLTRDDSSFLDGPISSLDSKNPLWVEEQQSAGMNKRPADPRTVAALQFGEPSQNVYSNKSYWIGFNVEQTLKNLNSQGLQLSLQSQILKHNLQQNQAEQLRIFDIKILSSSQEAKLWQFRLIINDTLHELTGCSIIPPNFQIPGIDSKPTPTPTPGDNDGSNDDDDRNKFVGGIVGGVIAGCAAISAGIAIARRRATVRPESMVFEMNGNMAPVQDNPLYANQNRVYHNELYQGGGAASNSDLPSLRNAGGSRENLLLNA
ncbi:hypothetical protein MP228_012604 [Amoeboaphelidium protococcarum]|nr:hypothetical protein MP228_012604 [Amoeboaphelidium protococcarum]